MDACSFVEGLTKDDFLVDKRTQQAVIMSLIILGEAATKVMGSYAEFTQAHPEVPWRSSAVCATELLTAILTSTSKWCGTLCRRRCRSCLNDCLPFSGMPRRIISPEKIEHSYSNAVGGRLRTHQLREIQAMLIGYARVSTQDRTRNCRGKP